MVDLKEKVIVITGGGTGLGREVVLEAVKHGAKVSICVRSESHVKRLNEDLSSFPGQFLVTLADASVEADVQRFVQATLSTFGQIDILVNNAAIFENYNVVDSSLESWERHFENNVTSAFLMTRECLSSMKTNKKGRIISVTSGLARVGASGFSAYSASKAALEAFTFTVEEEEHTNGITVAVFNPGVMKTKLQASGDDPKLVAPYLLAIASENTLSHSEVISIEDVKNKMINL
ncbi:SDR family NAD(P)-dependent oxidoreductase [Bacillus alkalicellulosilyticus]|uniref:SDR family NAD(P)-dependent oxidoreductase n=1 Tax=Alkalihalobacterium alkalicellulosilyticum TaxID=1912214 RepID=UPI001FE536EE|nr:SDR family oxidoreductase [Bacillus alkalicellulosilyticus]